MDGDTIRRDPNRTVIPGIVVDAVVEEPFACHPSFAQGYYDRDNAFYLAWDAIARDPATLEAWLQEWVYDLGSTPTTSRSGASALGFAASPAPRSPARSTTGATRERPSDSQERADDRRERAAARRRRELLRRRRAAEHRLQPRAAHGRAELQLVYESGVFGARPERLPLSIGDPTLATGSTAVTSMFELFAFYLQAGLIDVGVPRRRADRPVRQPEHDRDRRLRARRRCGCPGSGGACEIAIHARKILVIMRQAERSFVEKLHFRTSPGHSGDPSTTGRGAGRGAARRTS